MTETPFYFPSNGHSLFGMLHEPAAAPSRVPFVFCHPLCEEKLWAHRVFVSFARQLAVEGHPVLRFDYMGNGDSDGDFSAVSLQTIAADVRAATDVARQKTGADKVNLLGLRFGGLIASLVAEELDTVERLLLWAPVVDGSRYMQELLRINLTTQMAIHKEVREDRAALVAQMEQGATVNVDGYEMALPLYTEVSAVKLTDSPKRFAGRCLITSIERQPRSSPELDKLAGSYQRATVACAQEEPFWKEIQRFYDRAPGLFDATTEWLRTS
jgi:exosortase A-associated hydrolase 2